MCLLGGKLVENRRHNLLDPTSQLHKVFCLKPNKPLEICLMDEHKNHDTVTAEAERTEKQKLLLETQTRFQQKKRGETEAASEVERCCEVS
ncbi:uncharacterized protein ftr01 [Danio aesculapii]|uniref:uncharacterized protein ftr01 n=1 Tax=Danio aesculapii TaxID=1142201 RepID=UPI0024C090B1|nr:uncharacterized protein ftr01 [Danio aesculapii]